MLWDEKCHLREQNEALEDTSKKESRSIWMAPYLVLEREITLDFYRMSNWFQLQDFLLAIQDALNDRCLRYVIYIFFAITNLIHFFVFFFVSDVLSKIEIMAMADEKKPTIVRQGWLQKRGKLLSLLLLLLLCFNKALNEATVLNRSCQSWQLWIFLFCNLFKLRS